MELQCPHNSCTIVGMDGRVQYFWASTNGLGSYYNYSGPGALYYSADQAGLAALNYIKDRGLMSPYWDYNTNQLGTMEPGGKVYGDQNGVYSFSEPNQGDFCADGSAFCRVDIRLATVPGGATIVGMYHAHSDWWIYDPGGFSAEDFYAAERGAFGYPVSSYLLTLEGAMAVFDLSLQAPHIFVFPGPPLIH